MNPVSLVYHVTFSESAEVEVRNKGEVWARLKDWALDDGTVTVWGNWVESAIELTSYDFALIGHIPGY
jgi:hypothetical protein